LDLKPRDPVIKPRRRRCLCCQKLFSRDPRLRHRQKYCSEPACRSASKQSSQRRWLRKADNHEYFRGEQHVDRVQAWRAKNPGYWRKAALIDEPLQEMIMTQADDLDKKYGSLALQETRPAQIPDPREESGSLGRAPLQDSMS
jgi:hypothetical protein